jgi:GNAT superfamily N-acetyltransferase
VGQARLAFVAVGPTRDADRDHESVGEFRTIMVDRSERGLGVGRVLLDARERSMLAAGFEIATLWVVPTNLHAVRCYERGAWTEFLAAAG